MLIANDLKNEENNHRVMLLANTFIGVFTMIGLVSFIASQVSTYTTRARVSEVFVRFSVAREQVMGDYTYLSNWPEQKILEKRPHRSSNYVEEITFNGKGTIDFLFSDQEPKLEGKKLSFVATRSKRNDVNKIIWNCGFAEPLTGFEAVGINNTTVEPKYLPRSCRATH